MGRTMIRIKGKANEAMLDLSKRLKISPSQVIDKLLIQHFNAVRDDMLCTKKFFKSSIVYRLELPFSFQYEYEDFELELKGSKLRFYFERIPKRYVIDRLPFRTLVTVIIKLTPEEEEFAKREEAHVVGNKLSSRYSVLAFNVLKKLLITYRRVTDDYYNIGVIEPPLNLEEFEKKVKMSIISNGEERLSSHFMPIKEESYIVVAQRLKEETSSKIVSLVARELEGEKPDFLARANEYLDAAKVFYYHEQWDLCLLQSVIAMESAMASLVFKSATTRFYISRRKTNLDGLRRIYKQALGLPQKIRKFLFPVVNELGLSQAKSELKTMMPFIHNKKRQDGIYDMRSKVVHEGIPISKGQAEQAVKIALQFLHILNLINDYVVSQLENPE